MKDYVVVLSSIMRRQYHNALHNSNPFLPIYEIGKDYNMCESSYVLTEQDGMLVWLCACNHCNKI